MSAYLDASPDFEEDFGHGRLQVWLPRADLAITRVEGRYSNAVAEAFTRELEPQIKGTARFVGVHDWTDADGFDVAVPGRLATWTVSHLGNIERIVIATKHPLMSMAVRTVNLTLKRVEHVGSREAFLTALDSLC